MKPFEHNGKQYTNADAYRSAKAMSPAKAPAPTAPEGGQESPQDVVAQHGPAREVHIAHEHEMGSHHVHSIHADGHEHHSDHASSGEAHDHAKMLADDSQGGREEEDEFDQE